MNLIDEKVILSAAKSYSKIGETNRYDCDKLDAFIQGALEAQQQLHPFIVEFAEFCSSVERNSLTGLYWFNLKHLTTKQLLEEFINTKKQ